MAIVGFTCLLFGAVQLLLTFQDSEAVASKLLYSPFHYHHNSPPWARALGNREMTAESSVSDSPWGDMFFCLEGSFVIDRSKNYTVCGDGYCLCQQGLADCAGHHGNLAYVPKLPDDIVLLNFSKNGLTTITSDDFFSNVSNLAVLDISKNNVSSIGPGVLRVFTNLQFLCARYSKLKYDNLPPVLETSSLRLLDISFAGLGTPPAGLFDRYSLSNLSTLILMFNNIQNVNMSLFAPLTNLTRLSLWGNPLASTTVKTSYMPRLLSLDLSQTSFTDFFETCHNNTSLFPSLEALSLSMSPVLMTGTPALCLPRLNFLSLDQTELGILYEDLFSPAAFPALQFLTLIANSQVYTIQPNAFRNPTLIGVDISYSNIDFSHEAISADMFSGCPSLQQVVLSNNEFQNVDDVKFNHLFSQAPSLSSIVLASAHIGRVREDMFTKLDQLQELELQFNRINQLPDGVFDSVPNLQTLSLAFNQIQTIRETTFSATIRNNLQVLSLSNNAFQCDCDLRWFRNWLVSQPALFHFINDQPPFFDPSENRYMCTNLASTTVQSFFVADQACVWSPAVSKFIIASIVLLLLPLAMATALYRYRWHIRLVLFEAFRGQDDRWRRLQEQNFRYDVFVSYDSQDLGWVRAHLMPELEGRLGLRLCIHERDFTLGVPIVENIEESVQTSKKVLMVFSQNFAKSQWCQFELRLCLSHVMEQGDVLLVVLLEEIPSRVLTPAMMAVMKTTTYIEWADEEDARHSFWQRMRLALHEVLPANRA